MNKKYLDSRKGSVESTINTIRTEQKTIVKEEPKVSLQPKSYFGQKEGSLADAAAKVVSEDTHIYVGGKNENAEMDAVNDIALKKKFKDRKDKDIDNDGDTDASDKYLHTKRQAVSKALSKDEQAHIKKEFGIKYEALSPEKQKQMDQLMKDFLKRGGKIKKIAPGVKTDPKKLLLKKKLAAHNSGNDNSDDLANGKTATGQKVSKVDTKPNIREI